MKIEWLHVLKGDNKIEIDTDTEEGRKKVAELFQIQIKAGTAIFLERAGETYRVTGYDPATDKLTVQVPTAAGNKRTTARVKNSDAVVGTAPVAGGLCG